MNLAIIKDDTVINVIVCDSYELAYELTGADEVIDSDANQVFMNYRRIDGTWIPPETVVE